MVDLRQLSPGVKVKIVDEWCPGCLEEPWGKMNKYLGTIMTVKSVEFSDYVCDSYARMVEDIDDAGGWCWFSPAIEYVVEEDDVDFDAYDETIKHIDDFMQKFTVK